MVVFLIQHMIERFCCLVLERHSSAAECEGRLDSLNTMTARILCLHHEFEAKSCLMKRVNFFKPVPVF